MVTPTGSRPASAFGVKVESLPPPDGLLPPANVHRARSGCAKGDIVTSSGIGQPVASGGGNGRSPVAVGVVLFLVVIIVGVDHVLSSCGAAKMRGSSGRHSCEAELREDRSRGRL